MSVILSGFKCANRIGFMQKINPPNQKSLLYNIWLKKSEISLFVEIFSVVNIQFDFYEPKNLFKCTFYIYALWL